jgi:PAS domain S-box-containing protein
VEQALSANPDLEGEKGGDGAPRAGPADTAVIRQQDPAASLFVAQLQKTLNAIPAYTWYKLASGVLTFVNERSGDYLGLPKDHPLRYGIDTGGAWDSHILIIHPDDQDVARNCWTECFATGSAGEASFRIRNGEGEYRWFIVRTEPLRASDGTLLCWIGISLDIEERKQAEFYLTEGQRIARIGSWAFGPEGFEYWSPQLFEIHGLKPGRKAPGTAEYMLLVHPEDREFVAQEIRKTLADRCGFDFTKRIVRPDGAIRHVRCVGIPSPNGQGLMGTGIDVTEQEQLTKALRKSEEEFRRILDLTPLFITVLGPRRERLYINRFGLDHLGTTLERWREAEPKTEVHPDDLEPLMILWRRALSNGLPFECEFRSLRRDGIYRWFLARCNPLRDEEGRILRWYLAFTDIEDRKWAEERLKQENAALREEINQAPMFEQIVGFSEPLQKVVAATGKVAQSDSTVLILGETGTGKELIARAIHRRSRRSAHAFIAVNCGAIPSALIASELFGHEKGAFTGATHRRLGRFEAANGGTIFLDEVGDLPPDTQIALLRVLQEREIERVGGDKPIAVDVRVLAATHRDLRRLVSEGKFRRDLFYRLNIVPIEVPPLRERAADIPMLVEYFMDRFGKKAGKKFQRIGKRALDVLQAYEWPGNVRELQNVIERAVTLSDSDVFSVDEAWLKREVSESPDSSPVLNDVLLTHEKEAIETALSQSRGRISGPAGAAARLGIPTTTLDSKIRRLGIDKYRFKRADP